MKGIEIYLLSLIPELKDTDRPFICICDYWSICIPYEGNEHLVGIMDKPEE